MAISVEQISLDTDARLVRIRYDPELFTGSEVYIHAEYATQPSYTASNGGVAVLAFPQSYSGQSQVTISDGHGNEQTGVIATIGAELLNGP